MLSSLSNRKLPPMPLEAWWWPKCWICREFKYDQNNEAALATELVLQVRKVIGPFAAPKKIFIVSDLPKTRSGKVRSSTTVCCTWCLTPPFFLFVSGRLCVESCARSLPEKVISLEILVPSLTQVSSMSLRRGSRTVLELSFVGLGLGMNEDVIPFVACTVIFFVSFWPMWTFGLWHDGGLRSLLFFFLCKKNCRRSTLSSPSYFRHISNSQCWPLVCFSPWKVRLGTSLPTMRRPWDVYI